MSRYSHSVVVSKTGSKYGKKVVVAYGYDKPLKEYYIQVMPDHESEDSDVVMIERGTYTTNTPKHEMVYMYQIFQCDDKHITAVALDLPF